MGNPKLASEIVESVSTIPIECQEHILDIIKAMAFTRRVIESGCSEGIDAGKYGKKETA